MSATRCSEGTEWSGMPDLHLGASCRGGLVHEPLASTWFNPTRAGCGSNLRSCLACQNGMQDRGQLFPFPTHQHSTTNPASEFLPAVGTISFRMAADPKAKLRMHGTPQNLCGSEHTMGMSLHFACFGDLQCPAGGSALGGSASYCPHC